jgi:hypothetical protein
MGYENCIQNGPHNCCGSANSSGFEGKTHQSGQHHPERTERGMERHKWWPTDGASRAPSRGPDILKLDIRVPTGRFPSCPSVWAGI